MPITLNHSNISVQYETGSNYIIETVKSDLYRRNEIVDTIIRNNIQSAPVTPTTFVDSGNVYAVESYTYSGTANTTDYTRVFTKNTTCDILVVGGGGGGGNFGGGGGGGDVVYITNTSLSIGTYNISVGAGGTRNEGTNLSGNNGNNSSISGSGISTIAAAGGGGGAGHQQNARVAPSIGTSSGGGGGGSGGFQTGAASQYSGAGGNGTAELTPGGGGGGSVGPGGTSTIKSKAGNGGIGNDISITGTSQQYGGGGGGGNWAGEFTQISPNIGGGTGVYGGGNGAYTSASVGFIGTPGTPNTGGGGGGGGGVYVQGYPGGSGIVIIRYLLGTIPSTNYLTTEPVVIAPAFTESVRAFTHSGGTENQTTHSITIGQNTICDILVVGGGGGGGPGHGGGGGAGQLVLIHQATLNGTYTINVGKGGIGGRSSELANSFPATKGSNSSFGTVIAEGGGANTNVASDKDGGSGAGGDGYNNDGGTSGFGNKNTTIDTFPGATLYSRGNNGGSNTGATGGGGGGAGSAAPAGSTTTPFSIGGDGLSGISDINYDFKTNFGNYGKLESDGNYWFAGGGGGGSSSVSAFGGKGGGGNGSYNPANVGNATNNTGSGGGGGAAGSGSGGAGGSGIVIIRFKSIVGTGILDGITHKRLNFAYTPNYPSIQADNTNLIVWYKFDDPGYIGKDEFNLRNLTNTIVSTTSDLIGTSASFTNESYLSISNFNLNFDNTITTTGISFSFWFKLDSGSEYYGHLFTWGTHNSLEKFALIRNNLELKLTIQQGTNLPNTFDILAYNTWIHLVINIDTSRVLRVYQNTILVYTLTLTPSLYSGLTTSSPFTLGRANGANIHDYRGGLEDFRIYNKVLTSIEISQLYSISTPNIYTYTLNFPVPTLADINNNSNIVLRGAYDIALSTTNSIIIPKANQYIPKPTTFTNYAVERMYPPVRNFTAATTTVSGQTYGNGTYVVTFSTSLDANLAPYTCFNTSQGSGGHWTAGYTAGNYNGSAFVVAGYLGDWLKIQLPVAIKLTRFEFLMRTDTYAITERSPKDFKIYGSNDNITWVELVNKTNAVYDSSFRYIQLTQDITTAYTYYGLVVNKLLGSTADTLNFNEWYIYGQEVLPSSLSIRYHLLNPTLDPIGAQWTYNTSNMNVYNMGSVGIGTTNPEYSLDVSGSLNAKTLMYNGSSINSLGLSVGMIAQVQHLTYTKMEVKDNTEWDAINEDLTSGFVIKITPKSSLSKMLVNLIVFIGMSTSADNAWWGIKLYRKIGTGNWIEITGCNGTETGSAAATAGTPVWISNNTGMVGYNESITNASGTYLDSPNTAATVYYTAYWNQRIGDNPSVTGQMFLNRASSQNDAYRPAPSSSWTVEEIWYG